MPQSFVTIIWGKENKLKVKQHGNAECYKVPQEVAKVYFKTYYTTEELIGIGMKHLFKIKDA